MSATVHQAFRDSAARHGAQPFLCILPETAEAYGIAAGELAYGAAPRPSRRCAPPMRAPATATATAPACCLKTAPPSSCTGSRSTRWACRWCPSIPDLRAAELEYLTGHSEIALAVALPGRHAELLAAAAARAGRELRVMGPDDAPPPRPSPRRWPAASRAS